MRQLARSIRFTRSLDSIASKARWMASSRAFATLDSFQFTNSGAGFCGASLRAPSLENDAILSEQEIPQWARLGAIQAAHQCHQARVIMLRLALRLPRFALVVADHKRAILPGRLHLCTAPAAGVARDSASALYHRCD
jgi:hypothetical protein